MINLYLHEIALHVDHNVDEFQPPFTEEKLFGSNSKESNLLSSAHISALSVCLTSVDGVFESFLSLEVDVIRNLPIFHFVRTAYAIIVLIKMYFSAASSNSELGKVIDKDHMKVEQYLDGLLEKFRAAAEEERFKTGTNEHPHEVNSSLTIPSFKIPHGSCNVKDLVSTPKGWETI